MLYPLPTWTLELMQGKDFLSSPYLDTGIRAGEVVSFPYLDTAVNARGGYCILPYLDTGIMQGEADVPLPGYRNICMQVEAVVSSSNLDT